MGGSVCDSPWPVLNTVIITCIPAMNGASCTNTWHNKYCTIIKLRKIKLSASTPMRWAWIKVEIFSKWSTSGTTDQSKITGLGSALSCIKLSTNHIFFPMKCRFALEPQFVVPFNTFVKNNFLITTVHWLVPTFPAQNTKWSYGNWHRWGASSHPA